MSQLRTTMIGALCCMCLFAGRSIACTTPPYVYISDWVHYVGVDEYVQITANDYSSTYILDWWWYYPYESDAYVYAQYDDGGYGGSSRLDIRFGNPGQWTVYANALNTSFCTDDDYAYVYVVGVDEVVDYVTEEDYQILVPCSGAVVLKAKPDPAGVSFPDGRPEWDI